MYDHLNTAIREHDEDRLIFFESVTWEVTGIGERIGFEHAPGGHEYANRSVLSFHNSISPDKFPQTGYYVQKWKEIERLGIAGAVTETNADQEDGIKMTLADQYGLTWMHWAYKKFADWTGDSFGLFKFPCDENTMKDCLLTDYARMYARTYPRAVAGTTKEFLYNNRTFDASLEFIPKQSCSLPSELFVSS